EKAKRALSIPFQLPAVAAVVNDLVVAVGFALDDHISENERAAISRIGANLRRILSVDEIELATAAFDPIATPAATGRAELDVVARTAGAQRADPVELKNHSGGFGVTVVLKNASLDSVAVNPAALDQRVAREAADEKSVRAVVQLAATDRDVLAFFNPDRRSR